MKAEHRKELQTNALADRIGRFFQNMKSGTQSTSLMVWVIAAVVIIVLGTWWYLSRRARDARSDLWVSLDAVPEVQRPRASPFDFNARPTNTTELEKASLEDLEAIIENHPGTKQAMIARFRRAEINLRPRGVDLLPNDPTKALGYLRDARAEYEKLAEECKGDPYWQPQALLGVARCVETEAVQDPDIIDKAAKLYANLAAEHPDSAAGREARKRADELKDPKRLESVKEFYNELRKGLNVNRKK